MNQVLSLFSEKIVQAIGWTLLHSLWQGALLALLLGFIMLLLHRHTARIRYIIAGSTLLVQVLLSAITFDHYILRASEEPFSGSGAIAISSTAPFEETTLAADTYFWTAPLFSAKLYFEQHLPLLVTLWLMGLVLMTLRFLGGLAYMQRLRHYKTTPLSEKWQQRLSLLRQELGMSKAVRLVESGMVKVPMAIGYAKPVILMPLGAVAGLSQAQVEAILAHELAHILRRDYLFNLLQSVIDILFFYHPAMWWISGQVRAERENCCDDMAVSVCGNNLIYARALAELEAMRMPAGPALSVAFSGSRGSLISRIKRLAGQQSFRPTFTEGFVAAFVLMAGILAFSFGAMASLKPENKISEKVEAATFSKETTPAITAGSEETNAFSFTAQDSTGQKRDVVIIQNKKGKVKELYVDGKRIPKKDIAAYNNLIEQRLQAIENAPKASAAEVAKAMTEERNAVAKAERRQQENYDYSFRFYAGQGDSLSYPPAPPMPPMTPMAPMPPMPPAPPAPPLSGDKEAQKRYSEAMKQYEKEIKEFEQRVQRSVKEVQRHDERAALQAEHSRGMARRHEEMAVKHKEMAKLHQERMQQLKKEMVKDGLLKKDTGEIDIRMTKDSFYVNGEKQSQELFEKYKKLLDVKVEGEGNYNFQYNLK
ncbi:M56 family metallopeptidase [Pontibacter locisalis]|uniref:M56 family metallopeptidase n=1 Tax=Pontibacter locisalis TaxID=1719035 RepID=A0ABW5ILN1_9BACT